LNNKQYFFDTNNKYRKGRNLMAYSYKGAISFGLIYIPINLQASVKNNDVSFNLLDKNTMSRIKYKKTCVDCDDKEVKQQDIVKGYEYEKDKYVIFDDKDFEKIKSAKDKNITIEKFVDISEIDPIYYDKAYYVLPTGAEKAYALLATSMEEAGKVGIAKTVLGTKETLVAVRVKDGKMLLSTMFFNDEVQKNLVKNIDAQPSEKEITMAKTIIEAMSGKFTPSEYHDEYREKLQKAIEEKIAGKEITASKARSMGTVTNLMEALEKTLSGVSKGKKPSATVKKKSKKASGE